MKVNLDIYQLIIWGRMRKSWGNKIGGKVCGYIWEKREWGKTENEAKFGKHNSRSLIGKVIFIGYKRVT